LGIPKGEDRLGQVVVNRMTQAERDELRLEIISGEGELREV
jgi:hypothetical protein